MDDNVHVTARAVETNVSRMVAAYTQSVALDIDAIRDRLRELRGKTIPSHCSNVMHSAPWR